MSRKQATGVPEMGLPRSLSDYKKNWEPRLTSHDPEVRQKAMQEFITSGLSELPEGGLEDAMKKKTRIVYLVSKALHADEPLIGGIVLSSLGSVLRINWDTIQHYLLSPALIREEIRLHGKGASVLYTDEGWEWLQRETNNLYDWFKAIAWVVHCENCGARIKPNQFLVEYEGGWEKTTKTLVVKQRRYWCLKPRCRAAYTVRMASRLEGEEGERFRKQLEELRKRDPRVDILLRKAETSISKEVS